ncbi:hypothetical protein O3M35_001643 [Rhynocoris fuscipes]|uniref:Aromatic amino acid beta-eliminating lyase/threonine aldolase domain-containing protein n=1 Tax=Rhynocoris fuscipes TaxID=488301 RepID=A0AAW1CVR4_9HEMI
MLSKQFVKVVTECVKQLNPVKIPKANVYSTIETLTYPENVRVVDYRSDTFSKPSQEMRRVMYEAKVGDDVYGEDPTVNELERKGAEMLGKEAALFVASGTMANLLAIMTHSDNRGCEIIVGDESHILLWEQAGAAQIAGVQLRTVANKQDGTFDLKDMVCKVRNNKAHSFLPRTSLVCVENTHNSCGGRVLPIDWLKELGETLKELQIPLHMDGARFFNSVVRTGIPANEIVKDCESINVCLSKGLGAPIGSLLIGSETFVKKARHLRKVLGGGMRQVGLMAAAGIYALDNMVARLQEDHDHCYAIARAIHDMGSKIVSVDLNAQETNILLINLDTSVVTAEEFCKRLRTVTNDDLKDEYPAAVKILPWSTNIARLVVCCNNNVQDAQVTIRKMQRVIAEYDQRLIRNHAHATP